MHRIVGTMGSATKGRGARDAGRGAGITVSVQTAKGVSSA